MWVPDCGPPTGRPNFKSLLRGGLGNRHGKLCVFGITKACPLKPYQHVSHPEFASGQVFKRVTPGPEAARLLASVFGVGHNAESRGYGYGRADLHAQEMADRAEPLLARSGWLPEPLRTPGQMFAVACKTRIRPAACQTVAILRVQHSCKSGVYWARVWRPQGACVLAMFGYNGRAETRLTLDGRKRWSI